MFHFGCEAQGDLMKPLEAAVQVDTIAKVQLEEEPNRESHEKTPLLYKYNNSYSVYILWHRQQMKCFNLMSLNAKAWKLVKWKKQ